MKRWEHCDICGAAFVDVYHDTDEGRLLESGERCPNGHYEYQFAYGNTQISIGDATWVYSYNEEKEASLVRQQEMDAATIKLRQEIWAGFVAQVKDATQ